MSHPNDYADIERRILAAIGTTDAATGKPTDLHRMRAAAMYNVPEPEVTEAQRRAGKEANFRLLYSHTPGWSPTGRTMRSEPQFQDFPARYKK